MKEITRQGIHSGFGLLLAGIILFFGKQTLLTFCLFCLALAIFLSIAKTKNFLHRQLNKTVRESQRLDEKNTPFAGAVFYLLGVICLLVFFENQTAILAGIIVLAIGDSVSTIAGKKFGKNKITSKHSLEGTIAGIAFSALGLAFFLPSYTALIAATTGMLSELLCLEDNFSIPLTSALIIIILA